MGKYVSSRALGLICCIRKSQWGDYCKPCFSLVIITHSRYQHAMKKLFVIATLPFLFGLQLLAQESRTNAPASESPIKISATEAKAHSGAEVIVTGKASEPDGARKFL